MVPEDMYVLSPRGDIIHTPVKKPYPHRPPKCTDCAPLFMKVNTRAEFFLVGRIHVFIFTLILCP